VTTAMIERRIEVTFACQLMMRSPEERTSV